MSASDRTQLRTPVALLLFNRPAFTAQVFEAVAAVRPKRLLVVADGPRGSHPEDPRLVAQARAVVERVDWPCQIDTCYAEANLGCGPRVSSGLDWVFERVDQAIILEDDCVPDPSFFAYCDELLDRYRDDPRVQMVSGCNPIGFDETCPWSYCFLQSYSIWGWATWRRAWRFYDYEMRAWPALRDTTWLERQLADVNGARVARLLLDATYDGRIKQWDFQWVLSGWLRGALAATPRRNLITNIGHGAAGTHMRNPEHPLADLPRHQLEFPLRHPPEVRASSELDHRLWAQGIERYPALVNEGRLRRAIQKAVGPLRTTTRRRRTSQ